MVVIAYSVVISMVLALFWPVVQTGINNFGIWIANSSETSPVLAPFIYGTLERLLLPFGLHHMLTIPMNYTSFGGTYTIATGVNAGSEVFGQDPLWLAWANDLINFKKAGDMAAYNNLLATVTPARFKVGQMIGATGLLLGIALAMYRRVDADKRKNYKSMFISTALAVFLTGVTEPLEFMFMFCAIPLYIVYAILQGCAFAMAGIIHLRLHSFGNLEFITRIPMSLQAGLGGDIINFVLCVVAFFLIGYFVAYFMIGKLNLATPGRLGNYTDDNANDAAADTKTEKKADKKADNGQAERIIALLGVIVLPITSGDTALRALRLSLSETLHIDQSTNGKRIKLAVPVFALVIAILVFAKTNADGFNILWRYFAWANQTLSLFAFLSITAWMFENGKGKWAWMPMIPGCFYTFICVTYIANAHIGFNIPWTPAYIIGVACAVAYVVACCMYGKKRAAKLLAK